MGLKGNNFFHNNKTGTALQPQSVSNTTVAGETIVEPWRIGRQITFILLGGAFASSANGACTVQGLRRDDGTTWEALKESDGTTDLEFTATALDDGGALEGDRLLGTIDMGDIDGETYEAIRLSFEEDATAAMLVGAAYVISDLYARPSGDTDDLFSKARA